MSTIQKVLISYEEYIRLKDIEKDYENLSREHEALKEKSKVHSAPNQSGGGNENEGLRSHIRQIVDLVKQEITIPARPSITTWQSYEAPYTVTAIGHPKNPINSPYPVNVNKSDLNDSFDEVKLLRRVPKDHQQAASELLKIIESRPNELTFDCNGVIYIDEQSVPGSNIFKLFPILFKKRASKNFSGLQDFINKINQMGLTHLIKYPIQHKEAMKLDAAISRTVPNTSTDQWWYIG